MKRRVLLMAMGCLVLSACNPPHKVDKDVVKQISREQNIVSDNIELMSLQDSPTLRIAVIENEVYFLKVRRDNSSSPIVVKQKLNLPFVDKRTMEATPFVQPIQPQVIIREVQVPVPAEKKMAKTEQSLEQPLLSQHPVARVIPAIQVEESLKDKYKRVGSFLSIKNENSANNK